MVQNRQLSLSGSDQVRARPGSRVRWLSWPALVGDLVGSAHLRKAFGHLNPGPILLSDLALAGLDSPLPAQPDWCPGSRVSGVVKVMTCSFTSPAGRSWQRAMSMCRKEPHEEGAGARSHRHQVQVLVAQRQTASWASTTLQKGSDCEVRSARGGPSRRCSWRRGPRVKPLHLLEYLLTSDRSPISNEIK